MHSAVFAWANDINADLAGPDNYLTSFAGALEYSTFPHARRPRNADHLGIYTRMDAWTRVVKEIRGNADDGDWSHAESLLMIAIADVFARTLSLMGNCRLP